MRTFFSTLARIGAKACLALALVAVVAPAQAADDLGNAKLMVTNLADQAITTISNDSLNDTQRKAKFSSLLRSNFDTATIGKFALGRYYRQATPAQQTEYNKLFQGMVVNVYNNRFKEYSGQTVQVGNARKDEKSGDIVVASTINQPSGGQPVPVDWRIRNNKIIDVLVTGVSMSQTQRDEFASVIQKGGGKIDALLDYLRKKQ